jgi:hypothetical protein
LWRYASDGADRLSYVLTSLNLGGNVADHRTLDQHIADSLKKDEANGELRSARTWGKPLDFGDGFNETPEELRTAFKMLKDAGYVPPEVEMIRELEALRTQLQNASGGDRQKLATKIADLQLRIQVRMENIRG